MDEPRVGFLGLGLMGSPMALHLVRAGRPLTVWNRTSERTQQLSDAGARVAPTAAAVFEQCDTVLMMLADEAAIDQVLGRDGSGFRVALAGRRVVHMGTTSAEYSAELARAVHAAGGQYVEAPVSGSRVPAERGELVVMLAGDPDAVEAVEPIVAAFSRQTVRCGGVPNALLTKLAVNLFLITMVTGLAESVHLASAAGLDLETFASVLDAGPMASSVSTVKLAKLLADDLAPQAAAHDVLKNARLVAEAARAAGAASPVLDVCHDLFSETVQMGLRDQDMVAVVEAIRARPVAQAT